MKDQVCCNLRRGFALAIAALLAAAWMAASSPHAAAAGTSSATAGPATKVDVNNADLATLETLPGVGAATAKKIVAGRPYNSIADLEKVKGLGKSKADKLDGMVTFGPTSAEAPATSKSKSTTSTTEQGTATTEHQPSTSEHTTEHETSQLAAGETININTASAEELDKLPGIGPTKAQAIVDYRNQHGNFKSIEDIENVKGIKQGTFSKIKDHITVGP